MQLVWYRISITLGGLLLYFLFIRQNLRLSGYDILKPFGIGIIICLHWLFFYGAIKASNVSVTMAAFSTGTLFTSIIEPLVYKRKIYWYEILIGLLIIGAILLIFSVEFSYRLGILLGVLAALTSSLFSVFNGLLIKRLHANQITFYELSGGLIGLSMYFFINGNFTPEFFQISSLDWLFLLILALVCTAFPFIASVNLMKKISPYTITLTVNLESIYGIILAFFLFGDSEKMTWTFYLSTLIILACIFLNVYLKNRFTKKVQQN